MQIASPQLRVAVAKAKEYVESLTEDLPDEAWFHLWPGAQFQERFFPSAVAKEYAWLVRGGIDERLAEIKAKLQLDPPEPVVRRLEVEKALLDRTYRTLSDEQDAQIRLLVYVQQTGTDPSLHQVARVLDPQLSRRERRRNNHTRRSLNGYKR